MLAQAFRRLAHGLAHDRRGNVALIFALCLVPVVLLIGAAIDLGNAQRVRQQLQDATDSAVLAVARDGLSLTDAQLQPDADKYIRASYRYSQVPYTITTLTFDRTTVTAVLNTSANVPTSFLGILGISSVPVAAHAVSKGLGFEIALVLDNSGSMSQSAGSGGSKIAALKTASTTLLNTLFGTQTVSQRVSMSVVPFATSVNVGTANIAATWLDQTGKSSINSEDFVSATSRFALFTAMKNVSWAGCVISRPPPYDVDDTTPTTSAPNTLFVPWFAPDESDTDNSSNMSYTNNYLNDEGGTCSNGLSSKQIATLTAQSDAIKQARICKYTGVTPKTSSNPVGSIYGPNFLCDTPAITPLTNTRSTLDAAIAAMQPQGDTNILEGLTWGWRTLSPGAPFTQGKPYGAPNNRKVIILMTDGQNHILSQSNINYSIYSAAGYINTKRYGAATTNETTTGGYLDARTALACTNAKAQGIVIYTIAFGAAAAGSTTLLTNCASSPTYFYAPQNSSDLQPVFLAIAESINSLRLAE